MKKLLSVLGLVILGVAAAGAYDFSVTVNDTAFYFDIKSEAEKAVAVTFETDDHNSYSGDVVIPGTVEYDSNIYTVTEIGNRAFTGSKGMTSVVVPGTVVSIGQFGFSGCHGLTSLSLPESVKSIDEYAFYHCTNLRDVTLPNSAMSLKSDLFMDCPNLESVKLPDNLTTIPSGLFMRCYSLKECEIPETVTLIGADAFCGCRSLESIKIPESIKEIFTGTFYGCEGLTELKIPDSVTRIGAQAISYCNGLKSFTIGNSVTRLDHHTFSGCSNLEEVIVSESLNSVGEGAFVDCPALSAFRGAHVTSDNRCLVVDGKLVGFAPSGVKKYSIPEGPTSIGIYTFSELDELEELALPNSLTAIYRNAFDHSFNLVKVDFGNSLETIYEEAFMCTGLREIVFPKSLKTISCGAFSSCVNLEEIVFGEGLEKIDVYAFSNCKEIKKIKSLNPTPPSLHSRVGFTDDIFQDVALQVPEGSIKAYSSAETWKNFKHCEAIVPNGVENVELDDASRLDSARPVYDLRGVCVASSSTAADINSLPAGLYIIGNRKVLVK